MNKTIKLFLLVSCFFINSSKSSDFKNLPEDAKSLILTYYFKDLTFQHLQNHSNSLKLTCQWLNSFVVSFQSQYLQEIRLEYFNPNDLKLLKQWKMISLCVDLEKMLEWESFQELVNGLGEGSSIKLFKVADILLKDESIEQDSSLLCKILNFSNLENLSLPTNASFKEASENIFKYLKKDPKLQNLEINLWLDDDVLKNFSEAISQNTNLRNICFSVKIGVISKNASKFFQKAFIKNKTLTSISVLDYGYMTWSRQYLSKAFFSGVSRNNINHANYQVYFCEEELKQIGMFLGENCKLKSLCLGHSNIIFQENLLMDLCSIINKTKTLSKFGLVCNSIRDSNDNLLKIFQLNQNLEKLHLEVNFDHSEFHRMIEGIVRENKKLKELKIVCRDPKLGFLSDDGSKLSDALHKNQTLKK